MSLTTQSSQTLPFKWDNIQSVVVVGLGLTGLSVVNHILAQGVSPNKIKVIDTRTTPPGLANLHQDVTIHSGSWQQDWLLNTDLIVASPGIALATPELELASNSGVLIVGDIELFAWAVDAPVVAITGSNGKSTVTDLTGILAKSAGFNVAVGGNIGIPALDLLNQTNTKERSANKKPVDLYVLELSSFQLETTSNLKLKAAAFLNLSEDHMDRYDLNMDKYGDAKLRIFNHTEIAIVNRDDPRTWPDYSQLTTLDIKTISVGFDEPEFGIVRSIDNTNEYSNQSVKSLNKEELESRTYLARDGKALIATDALKMIGQHNLFNALVALALVESAGGIIQSDSVLNELANYTGLTHRCQVVVDNNGIKWVNDSKATNVASTLAALSGLQLNGQLHLLVGGVGKGADFSPLIPALLQLNVRLYCFGEDKKQFLSLHPTATPWNSMESIIEEITPNLSRGDVVMLSPACASFDQFANFMARGDEFTRLAKQYGK